MLDKTALIYDEGREAPLKNHFPFIVLETFLSGRGLFDPYGKQSNEKMSFRNTNFTIILIFHPLVSTVPFGVLPSGSIWNWVWIREFKLFSYLSTGIHLFTNTLLQCCGTVIFWYGMDPDPRIRTTD
jgi:hypothetical protein